MKFLSFLMFVIGLGGCSNEANVAEKNTTSEPALTRSEVAPDTAPDISDTDYAAFIESANEFGLDLAQQVTRLGELDKTKNGVFSPVSALSALAMAYAGAEADVKAAMKLALHDELAAEQYHVAQNRMMRELQSYNYSGVTASGEAVRIELAPANSLWAEQTVGIKTPFLDTLSREYDAGVYEVDFAGATDAARGAINAWVEGKTNDKIKELLQPGDIESTTRFVLVNALYLFANWQELFLKASTSDAPFATLAGDSKTVNMMHKTAAKLYKTKDSFDVVQVPYVNGQLYLTLVLPKEGQFETVRSSVSADWLKTANRGLTEQTVALRLPKFEIETRQIKLVPSLTELGVFDAGRTLTGIGESPVTVSEVIQKAYIGTDESGTEAAAATAVAVDGSDPQQPVEANFNRPFLFFIQGENGLVLFSGQVVDPTLKN